MSSITNIVPGRIDSVKKGDGRSERFRPVRPCFSSALWSTMTHEQLNHTLQNWRPLEKHFLLTCLFPPDPSGLVLLIEASPRSCAHLIAVLKSFLALFFFFLPCLLLYTTRLLTQHLSVMFSSSFHSREFHHIHRIVLHQT